MGHLDIIDINLSLSKIEYAIPVVFAKSIRLIDFSVFGKFAIGFHCIMKIRR